MNTYKIAVLAGDGIGPEVMAEALRVLDAVEQKFGFATERTECYVGGAGIDNCGKALPAETLAACEAADAILFGSVGGPKWDSLPPDERPERGALLPLRKHFSLFANLRPGICLPELVDASPVKNSLIPGGFDILCVRELTGGMYFGEPKFYGERDGEIIGLDTLLYKKSEVERIARVAFEAASGRNKKLCSVDKANVLASSVMWRDVMNAIAPEYPDVELTHMYVDNAAMQLVRNPQQFDVMVTENTFGDILTDEMAIVCGSLGMLPSASLSHGSNTFFGLYEPSGGSAPDIAGKGIANPVGTFWAIAMMLEQLKEKASADLLMDAICNVLKEGKFTTPDIGGKATTTEMTDAVIACIKG